MRGVWGPRCIWRHCGSNDAPRKVDVAHHHGRPPNSHSQTWRRSDSWRLLPFPELSPGKIIVMHQLTYRSDANQSTLVQSSTGNRARKHIHLPSNSGCTLISRLDMCLRRVDNASNTSVHNLGICKDYHRVSAFPSQPYIESPIRVFEDAGPALISPDPKVPSTISPTQYLTCDERLSMYRTFEPGAGRPICLTRRRDDKIRKHPIRCRSQVQRPSEKLSCDAFYCNADLQETIDSPSHQYPNSTASQWADKAAVKLLGRIRLTQSPDSGYEGTIYSRDSTPSCLSEPREVALETAPHGHVELLTQTPIERDLISIENAEDSFRISSLYCCDIESCTDFDTLHNDDCVSLPTARKYHIFTRRGSGDFQSTGHDDQQWQNPSMP